MATAAGSEGDSVDLGAGLEEDSAGVAVLVGAEALGAAVAAEVGLLGGSFRGRWHGISTKLTISVPQLLSPNKDAAASIFAESPKAISSSSTSEKHIKHNAAAVNFSSCAEK